jgi:putative ABC transport system permease protein
LPKSLLERIQAVPGVADVTYANWFGGIYQDQKNFFPNQAVSGNYLDAYPEWKISAAEREAFRNTRTGAVVGALLAEKFHWKVGDKIPLLATIFPQKGGSNTWVFDLVGIYRVSDPQQRAQENALLFNWDYFDEARAFGNGNVGWYVIRVADPNNADRVAQSIDALSVDSDHETKTQSEHAFQLAFVSQFGDIGLIVGAIMAAVFFTLILLTGNTMAQAVRERIPELAILKTIGFTSGSVLGLLLAEAVMLLLVGGIIGIVLAAVVANGLQLSMGIALPPIISSAAVWLRSLTLMMLIGIIVGAAPAYRGLRLRVVDGLAGR